MSIAFSRYLSAKSALDTRSLNPEVWRLFESALRARPGARILDLGAGSGEGLGRVLEIDGLGDLEVVALDRDASLLALALETVAKALSRRGFTVEHEPDGLCGRQSGREIRYRIIEADLMDYAPEAPFEVILAHHLMDLIPPAWVVDRLLRWLVPRGLFYATLIYDGETTLLPLDPVDRFEPCLLDVYAQSMRREVRGLWTGGPQSARALHAALFTAGQDILALGASDWSLAPVFGAYREDDVCCLEAVLAMIYQEGRRAEGMDLEQLEVWYQKRLGHLRKGQLALIVHQLDLLVSRSMRG